MISFRHWFNSLDWPITRCQGLSTENSTMWKNTDKTSMSQVRFESTIPVFEQSKTIDASDHMVTVIGIEYFLS
jgi:ligand-binding sensor protein